MKPTTEELLERLDTMRKSCAALYEGKERGCPECPCGRCEHELEAIRALIVEAPAKQAQIDEQIKLIDEYVILQGKIKEWRDRIGPLLDADTLGLSELLEDIRDFGKEEK